MTSLSVEGIRFVVQNLALGVGDTYTIAFSLDKAAKTAIVDEFSICNVHNEMVGAKFLASHGYNPDIDDYLMELSNQDSDESFLSLSVRPAGSACSASSSTLLNSYRQRAR